MLICGIVSPQRETGDWAINGRIAATFARHVKHVACRHDRYAVAGGNDACGKRLSADFALSFRRFLLHKAVPSALYGKIDYIYFNDSTLGA